MNCPHCHRKLPGNYVATYCPHCGRDLAAEEVTPVFAPAYLRWGRFLVVLVAPAVASFIFIAAGVGDMAVVSGLAGSFVAGLICAKMVMEHVSAEGFLRGVIHFG